LGALGKGRVSSRLILFGEGSLRRAGEKQANEPDHDVQAKEAS
jgi:hypothetical protein